MTKTPRDPQLLICQVEPPQSEDGGDYFYRTHAPGLAMAQERGVHVVNLANLHRKKNEIMEQADVLILKNLCDPDLLPLIAERRRSCKITVFEIADDLSALQPWNPVYAFYRDEENQALIHRLAKGCNALQVTCSELKRIYGHLNRICEIFENQMVDLLPERHREENGPLVIGWGGSHGHLADLAEIAPTLIAWILETPHVSLRLMCSDPIWSLFDPLPPERKTRVPTGSIHDYYRFLSAVDIGIAPLRDTAFNRSRSDIKFLEYAAAGIVPVMQYLEPYRSTVLQGTTGLFFRDPGELIRSLDQLVNQPKLRARIAKAAREYVLRERMQGKDAGRRVAFYRSLLDDLSGEPANPTQASKRLRAWSRLEGAVREGNHLKLASTRYEMLLHDGLIAMQVLGDGKTARRLFQEASAMEPGDYLPYLLSAPVSPDPLSTLAKAIERNPRSIKARVLLGEAMAERGRIAEALRSFASSLEIFPDYEVPFRRVASLLKRLGQESQADLFLRRAEALLKQGQPPHGAASTEPCGPPLSGM